MITIVLLITLSSAACTKRKPIVLVPGIMRTVLNVETNIPSSVSYEDIPRTCDRNMAEQLLWKNFTMFATEPRCVLKFLKGHFNSETNLLDTVEGVNFKVPQFGKVYACKNTAPESKNNQDPYFAGLIQQLENNGYQDGVDLFCAGYDWRSSVKKMTTFFKDTEALIKQIYQSTGQKVTILSHSYGGFATKGLFDHFTDYSTYIEQWISSGTPWGGAFETIGTMTYGLDDFNVDLALVTEMTRSIEGNYQLMPNKYWGSSNFMKVNGVDYGYHNIDEMLNHLTDFASKVYREIEISFDNMPTIKKYCTVSNGIETQEHVEYADWTLTNPTITYGNGDGTVNYNSLTVCEQLGFEMTDLGKHKHTALLSTDVFIDYLLEKVCPA